jgi:hypothetical protein
MHRYLKTKKELLAQYAFNNIIKKRIMPLFANFVAYGIVANVFAIEKGIIQELKILLQLDLIFVTNVMENF